VARRICYIHIGPHKTGSSAIQWFLKEHRAELLMQGYFVPESGNVHGGHHPIVRKLCGQELPDHQQSAAVKFARELAETPCEAVVLSSEALDTLLRNTHYATVFFNRIEELNLAPKLVLFPRNQSQSINSRYAQVVKGFRRSESFGAFVEESSRCPSLGYSLWIELADAFHAELVARPFTTETITRGVVPEFLRAIGVNLSQFSDTTVRRNESAGPFTVSVARCVSRLIVSPGTQLTWLQAERCKKKLAAYLQEKRLADTGYCGLTTALALHIEKEWQHDNDAFACQIWGRRWAEIFAVDIGRDFMPNDFDISQPDESTKRKFRQAVHEVKPIMEKIILDPALAIEAAWNDLQRRAG
jgi:hypothetical protein